MAFVARQPFAPVDGSRLQTLTSCKNRQNAISTSPSKRKAADAVDTDDSENVDPVFFSKRSKGTDNFFTSKESIVKPSTFSITKSASTGNVGSSPKVSTPRPRGLLNPKSPAAKLNLSITKSTPLFAPAGRSPIRGKRTGILSSRRRTSGPYTRVDPPVFKLGLGGSSTRSSTPFSLDAALKGTIPSYASRNASQSAPRPSSDFSSLHEPEMKSDWFFDIHEDTPEQEMTNLLQHSTCILDISSDEESESRRQRERTEGKENVPPVDDVSQTSRPRGPKLAANVDDMVIEKDRLPLGEMNVKEYYADGCDETSVIIVPDNEDGEKQHPSENKSKDCSRSTPELEPAGAALEPAVKDGSKTAEELMQKSDEPVPPAALLVPMEGTGESFEVWESSSAKDETEAAVAEI